jgi:hypothetical protein
METHSNEDAKSARLTGPAKEAAAYGGGMGWLGRLGRLGRTPGRNFEFQFNLDHGKTLRNSTRRFRRNMVIEIFPKFF